MITISEVLEEIIRTTPFLEEGLSRGIINLSGLARRLKPRIEDRLYKKVEDGAIIMALKRLSLKIKPKLSISLGKTKPDLIVRSNLMEFVIPNPNFSLEKHKQILELFKSQNQYFLTITQGIFETNIIISDELKEKVRKILSKNEFSHQLINLSSITIRLPLENVYIPGLYYSFLKALAWEEINVIDVVSTYTEITLILEDKDIDRAFSLLKLSTA